MVPLILQYEAERRAAQVYVPTDPQEVIDKLRELGEPVTLFGERVRQKLIFPVWKHSSFLLTGHGRREHVTGEGQPKIAQGLLAYDLTQPLCLAVLRCSLRRTELFLLRFSISYLLAATALCFQVHLTAAMPIYFALSLPSLSSAYALFSSLT